MDEQNASTPGVTEAVRVNERVQKLFTVTYEAQGPLRAALIWHHGYGEHVGRMKYVFSQLARAGIAVYSYDAHGHGQSEPKAAKERAFVRKFSDLVDDLDAFTKDVLRHLPKGTPAFLGGQSMGGLVVSHAALRKSCPWRGLVLTSALVDVEWTTTLKLQAKVGNLLAALIPRARIVEGVKPEDMSPDPAVVKDYIEDPLNLVGKLRARTSNELLRAFRELGQRKKELDLPIFAVHGTADRCTSLEAVKGLVTRCSSDDATFKEVEGGYHELLLGPERDEVISAVSEWILAHSAAPTAKL